MTMPFVVSKALAGVRHGFFGRQGGRSTGVFATNNMSIAAGDDAAIVQANRMDACRQLGHYSPQLVLLKQVHSTKVVVLTTPPDPRVLMEGDALVTNRHEVVLGILTADCAPVLLADPEGGVVAAAHAGWKGAVSGIVGKTVQAMVELGADRERIRAAIGPTISGHNYEVGPDTAAEIIAENPQAAAHVFVPEGGGREHFDIPALLQEQLFEAGVGTVADVGLCTYALPEDYFSHRYATHHGTTTGRQVALIGVA